MLRRSTYYLIALVLAVSASLESRAAGTGDEGSPAEKPRPTWKQVDQLVSAHFAKQTDYRAGDLISRGQVEALFAKLKQAGWDVADRKAIAAATLADSDFLVRELRTPAGRKFMRASAGHEGAYDRLDRLARLPRGQQTVKDLVRAKGGERMIEYLTTTTGGENLGGQLSNVPRGRDFNKPTGRLYTQKQLAARLKQSHAAEAR